MVFKAIIFHISFKPLIVFEGVVNCTAIVSCYFEFVENASILAFGLVKVQGAKANATCWTRCSDTVYLALHAARRRVVRHILVGIDQLVTAAKGFGMYHKTHWQLLIEGPTFIGNIGTQTAIAQVSVEVGLDRVIADRLIF